MSTPHHSARTGPLRVFVHIGAPKTGTTYLQHVLFNNAAALGEHGVLYPYGDLAQSFRSAHDFCGTGWFGLPPSLFRGEWDQLAEAVRNWRGHTAILSSELLSAAAPDRIERGLALLQPAEVHVIFSARDLARQLVSDWQEHVKHRHTVTLEKFVDDLVEFGLDAPEPFGRLFWGMHDAAYVLANWAKFLPIEQINVLTVPQRFGPKDALWTRFCAITGLDPTAYPTSTKRTNRSMGVAETELVRRINLGVKKVDAKSYDVLVRLFLAEKVLGRGSRRLSLPPHQWEWAEARSRHMIEELRAAGYPVEGDLADLMPAAPEAAYVSPTSLTDADLGPIAIKAATALLNRAGKLRDQNARLQAGDDPAGSGLRRSRLPAASDLAGAGRRAARRLLRKP
jgi:hypothetical protein